MPRSFGRQSVRNSIAESFTLNGRFVMKTTWLNKIVYLIPIKLMSFLIRRRIFFKNILDQYVKEAPKYQNAVDVFKGSWASRLPDLYGKLDSGPHDLFNDKRIIWAEKQLGGFTDKSILELGPLEAGHSFMLQNLGAGKVTAVEASTQAYLKCLVVKEMFALTKCNFLLGDIVKYLEQASNRYDICLASGVLYHMTQPVKMLHLVSEIAPKIILWTHYYDEKIVKDNYKLAARIAAPEVQSYAGIQFNAYKYNYHLGLAYNNFCGGANPYSYWLTKDTILECLDKFGFDKVTIKSHDIIPAGPSFMLVAEKTRP